MVLAEIGFTIWTIIDINELKEYNFETSKYTFYLGEVLGVESLTQASMFIVLTLALLFSNIFMIHNKKT